MTVQTNTNVASFNGNGVTQIFPVAFKFNNDTDLVVLRVDDTTGVASRLTLNSDYTVSGEGDESGGLINVVTAPLAGQRLIVSRIVDILQLVDLRNQGKFFAEVHEDAFDLLTMIAQQHETSLTSSIRVAEEDRAPKRLPSANSRADRLMGFDSNGDPVAVVPTSGTAAELAVDLLNSVDAAKGSAMVGHKGTTVRETLELSISQISALEAEVSAKKAYTELASAAGVLTIDVASAIAVGVELQENITSIVLVGAEVGESASIDIYFKQPDGEDGKSVALPSSVKVPSGVTGEVDTSRAATTLLRLVSVDGGVAWRLETRLVYFGVAMYQLPDIASENSTFNDEGDTVSGWTASNATLSVASSYLRQTKTAGGTNSSMTKAISFTPTDSDFILYGKVRAKSAPSHTAVIWLLNGSKEISIWFGSANAGGSHTQNAISIRGTTGASTAHILQVASGFNYETEAVDFALQYDHKFRTLTLWFRETDGRWKFKGRVACDWFSSSQVQALTTSDTPAGGWIEFDHLTLARPNIALLSDSIGEGKTLFSPDRSLALTNDESTWMRHAALYPSLRNNLVVNKGVGGNTSAQMLTRVADVTGTGAKVVFYHASSNDEAAGVSQSQRTSDVQSTISAMTAAGQSVVVLNAVYATQASADNTAPRALMAYAKEWWDNGRNTVTGVSVFIDIMSALKETSSDYMDPAKTQSDGIHPNIAGHTAVGDYIESFQ